MALVNLVSDDNWQGFDEAWRTAVDEGAPIDELLRALEVVATKRRMPRCLPLLREHATRLLESDRAADAALLLGQALRGGGAPSELAEPLMQAAEAAWGSESWWAPFTELAGFRTDTRDLRRAWNYFDDIRSYRKGMIFFHPAGWGTGEVLELDTDALEIEVRFQSGRRDRFPMSTALDIFESLPDDDLRAQSYRDPEGLKKRLKDDPLDVLRSVLVRYNGRASNVMLRNTLMQVGITGNAWTSWWRKTRLLAENSEWFQVTGKGNKVEVRMLARAVDPVEGLRTQLRNSRTLHEAVHRVRDLLAGGKCDETLRAAALESLVQLTDASTGPEEAQDRFASWLLLRDQLGETPAGMLELLREAAAAERPTDPSQAPRLWKLFHLAATSREQERCVALLQEVLGEAWLDEANAGLPHAPPAMVKPIIEALRKAKRLGDLAVHYRTLLARPTRNPHVLIGLAKAMESMSASVLEEHDLQGPQQRAQALLELGVFLEEHRRGNAALTRAHGKLTDLLAHGDKPLLRRLLENADATTLRSLRLMSQRGIDDPIDNLITDIAIERGSGALEEAAEFWETDQIWTTRDGIKRREQELRELREVKIPANREAIARAASYGDLAENAEWEQAIRDQSELTSQAAQMEKELAQAALLENANIPEDTVAPGTTVRFKDLVEGQEQEILLLGPWDTGREGAVFYRAPLAAGMLGKHSGDRVRIQLPRGETEVEILSVEVADVV